MLRKIIGLSLLSFLFTTGCGGSGKSDSSSSATSTGPGYYDTSFNGVGYVSTQAGVTPSQYEYTSDIAVQSDGKIIVVGSGTGPSDDDVFLMRYTSAGVLDTTFGTAGFVRFDGGGATTDHAGQIKVQADDYIIVAGGTGNCDNTLLVRYTPAGVLDSGFGTGGVAAQIGNFCYSTLDIQSNGKIVVGGWTYVNGPDYILSRYNTDGTIDNTFGNGGSISTADVAVFGSGIYNIVIQPDGKILATGDFSTSPFRSGIARFTSAGALDATFGTAGIVTPAYPTGDLEFYDLTLKSDGTFIVVGEYCTAVNEIGCHTLLMKYTSAGALDSSFGTSGQVILDLTSGWDGYYSVAVQSTGKIVATGSVCLDDWSQCSYLTSRYTANGAVDTSYGSNGHRIFSIGGAIEVPSGLVILSDDSILMGAGSSNGTVGLMGVAKFNGN